MNLGKYSTKSQTILVESQRTARSRQHQAIEPEHLLRALLVSEEGKGVLSRIGLKLEEVERKLEVELVKLPKIAGASNYLSPRFLKTTAAAEAQATRTGSKFVEASHLLASLSDPATSSGVAGKLLRDHGATRDRIENAIPVTSKGTAASQKDGEKNVLASCTVDLVQQAKDGKLDPIIGRGDEIRRLIQVLSRRSKNNPVLIGKPGVGKNSVIRGLAQRIALGDVPAPLKDKRLLSLDLGSLLAGATLRGQFEDRMKSIVSEVKASDGQIILFIDEIHTLVGAGGDGASDASQMLKPPLSRGEIQVLGATTPDEYRNSIEKDKALERRFQSILVEEPSFEETLSILRGVKGKYEVHHGVRIQDPALVAAIKFSQRYVAGRQLPDKALDLIDEAATRLKVSIDSVPDILDSEERSLTQLKIELRALTDTDRDTLEHKEKLEKRIESASKKTAEIRSAWEREVELIQSIRSLKENLAAAEKEFESAEKTGQVDRASELKYGQVKRLNEELEEKSNALHSIQAQAPLIKEEVEPSDIAAVLADITGIPVANMLESEKEKLLKMEEKIGQRVIGQKEALGGIAKAIRRSRSGLSDPNRPVGSFFFLGPTGCGKTELAKALTQFLFDDERSLIRLDMSEFQEKHTVSRLIGAPPGYKGADEGGQLTEAVRLKPYSVVLFDEVEKGHPDIFNILLQVLDDGRLTDSQSRLVDFKNTVIIMTSNVGSNHLLDAALDPSGSVDPTAKDAAFGDLKKTFRPEFLGRIDEVVMFHGLTRENIDAIAEISFKKIQGMLTSRRINLEITAEAKKAIVDVGFEPRFGARPLRRAIQRWLQDPLSVAVLEGGYEEGDTIKVVVTDPSKGADSICFERLAAAK
jgi:ATP-dependent Clp protease ATP-binding subunit ClpB